MNIMLVEDDYLLNKAIEQYFYNRNITSFNNGRDAFNALSNNYNLYIIDIDIPKMNGIELLKEIKTRYSESYVFIISATIEITTIEKAYTLGCHDYLKKPFDIKELEFKINLLEKKSEKILIFEDLYYDLNNSLIIYKNESTKLTTNESKLLNLLLTKRGNIVSSNEIEYSIWNYENSKDHIRQLVNRLKSKIPIDLIKNRKGQGYFLNDENLY